VTLCCSALDFRVDPPKTLDSKDPTALHARCLSPTLSLAELGFARCALRAPVFR
jgi:hypothetical protein